MYARLPASIRAFVRSCTCQSWRPPRTGKEVHVAGIPGLQCMLVVRRHSFCFCHAPRIKIGMHACMLQSLVCTYILLCILHLRKIFYNKKKLTTPSMIFLILPKLNNLSSLIQNHVEQMPPRQVEFERRAIKLDLTKICDHLARFLAALV